jgi:hypothetical protein
MGRFQAAVESYPITQAHTSARKRRAGQSTASYTSAEFDIGIAMNDESPDLPRRAALKSEKSFFRD